MTADDAAQREAREIAEALVSQASISDRPGQYNDLCGLAERVLTMAATARAESARLAAVVDEQATRLGRVEALRALWDGWDGGDHGFGTSPMVRNALAAALAGDDVEWSGRDRVPRTTRLDPTEDQP